MNRSALDYMRRLLEERSEVRVFSEQLKRVAEKVAKKRKQAAAARMRALIEKQVRVCTVFVREFSTDTVVVTILAHKTYYVQYEYMGVHTGSCIVITLDCHDCFAKLQ